MTQKLLADFLCQACRLVCRNVQNPAAHRQRRQLLVSVPYTGGQRRNVPVHMTITLLTAKAQNVEPLGWNHSLDGTAHPVYPTLETSVSGVFAAGDARAGSTKQLVSAAGEGATVALMMREYLRQANEARSTTRELERDAVQQN